MPDKTPDRPRIFLNNVHLKGFKSIEDLSIDFQKGLNVLIGKNGSGKSNFMGFLFRGILPNWDSNFQYIYSALEFESDDDHSFIIELDKELNEENIKGFFEKGIDRSERFTIDQNVVFDSNNENSKGF